VESIRQGTRVSTVRCKIADGRGVEIQSALVEIESSGH
jgi:hypothetical protein